MPKQTKPRPRQKTLYRVKNWTDYGNALVQRGSITFWLSDDFEKNWLYTGEKKRGSQFDYSDKAIEIMLTVKEVFHIPPRKNARIWQHGNAQAERLKRDENLRSIRKLGCKTWKQKPGYHVRLGMPQSYKSA